MICLTHAAHADLGGDFIRTEANAGGKGQTIGMSRPFASADGSLSSDAVMASDAVHARVPHRDSGTKTPDGSLVTPRPGAWDPVGIARRMTGRSIRRTSRRERVIEQLQARLSYPRGRAEPKRYGFRRLE